MSESQGQSPTSAELNEFLQATVPFNSWPLAARLALCELARPLTIEIAETLPLTRGDERFICLLTQGVCKLNVTVSNGRQQTISYFSAGALMGLGLAFARSQPEENHESVAHTQSRVWQVPAQMFKDFLLQHPAAALSVMEIIATRTALFIDELARASLLGAPARVANCLLNSFDPESDRSPQANFGWINGITQMELAAMLGLSRQSVGTVLREFESLGIVRLSRQNIEVLNLAKLLTVRDGPTPNGRRASDQIAQQLLAQRAALTPDGRRASDHVIGHVIGPVIGHVAGSHPPVLPLKSGN